MVNIAKSHPALKNRPIVLELTLRNADKPVNEEIGARVKTIVEMLNKGN